MAASSSLTVNTNQTEIGAYRAENVPVQVITLCLIKENYFLWSAAMTMGIAGRGRIAYIDGRNHEPAKTSGVWDTWFLEDNQVKTWIVNSVSTDIQPLILRQKTARDMWMILEQMYGQKKKAIRTYQLMKSVYGLRQGNLSVADYYGALKAKWEDLDYYSDITWHHPQDQALYVAKEWENRVFLFLAGLNDEFEGVRSLILNSGEVSSIEDVYSRVEAEEQSRLLLRERGIPCHIMRDLLLSIVVLETKGNRGRSSSGKPNVSEETKSSGGKVSIFAEQLRELKAYLGRIDVDQGDAIAGAPADVEAILKLRSSPPLRQRLSTHISLLLREVRRRRRSTTHERQHKSDAVKGVTPAAETVVLVSGKAPVAAAVVAAAAAAVAAAAATAAAVVAAAAVAAAGVTVVAGPGSISGPGPMGRGYRDWLGLQFAPRLELLRGFSPLSEVFHVYRVFLLLFHHEGEIVRLPLPLPLEFLRRRCRELLHRRRRCPFLRRRCRRSLCAAVADLSVPSSPDLCRRSPVSATASLSAPAPSDVPVSSPLLLCSSPLLWVFFCFLLHAVRCPAFLLLPCGASVLFLVMAEEIAPKTDVALDTGIAPKSENLPVQVTPIRLTKDNYLSWSAALEIGIRSRGRLPYITGDKPAPSKTDPQWVNWALEDSQVKVWIISSVSADIQPLILRKPTSFEMWNVLARMYGRKKRVLRTYQIKRSIYALKQGDLSVASFYAALKNKWEELDYHVEDNWDCGSDHARHWEKEWMDRTC
ncbi:hypothetical protein EJ110_NYTH55440 [Nymphaea thermarum]|nr:hypothetical protein EJ110_NYTH55440 [Nymphaea thermarum]